MAYDDRDDSGPEDDPAVVAAKRARGDAVCAKCGLLVTWDEDRCTSCGAPRPAASPAVTDAPRSPAAPTPWQPVGMPRFLESALWGVVGVACSRVFGPVVLVPMVTVVVGWLVVRFLLPPSARAVREAVVLQIAIVLWLAAAVIITHPFDVTWIEVMAVVSVTAWLGLRPGWIPVTLLTVYQVVVVIWISVHSTGKLEPYIEKGLALNLLLRVAAVAAMFLGLWRLRARPVAANGSADQIAATSRGTTRHPASRRPRRFHSHRRRTRRGRRPAK